jgi:hypothetical protein
MPYIEPKDRPRLDRDIDYMVNCILLSSKNTSDDVVGILNYVLTRIAVLITRELAVNHVNNTKKLSYALLDKIWGVLNGVASEFNRRVITPYEEKKKKENGDVYQELISLIDL